jgi:hypothetical protein
VDTPIVPLLRRQRGPPSVARAGLQSRQLHADAGDAEDGGAVVADQPAGEADRDRRQGRQSWPLHHVPNGRGRGVATDVRRHPVADRPVAGASRSSMTETVVRCDGRRRQRCASMKAKQQVAASRAEQIRRFGSQRGCLRSNLLRRTSMERKITPNGPGIWGMSALHRWPSSNDASGRQGGYPGRVNTRREGRLV